MRVNLFKNDYLFSIINKAISVITGFLTPVLMNRNMGPSLKDEYSYIMNVVKFGVYIREYQVKWYEPLVWRKGDLKEIITMFVR